MTRQTGSHGVLVLNFHANHADRHGMQSRLAARSRRPRGDAGMSLVEISVAMVILGIVLAAAAAALITFVKGISSNEGNVRANQLANATIERLRTANWNSVGFAPTAPGYRAARPDAPSQPTANLPSGASVDPQILPLRTVAPPAGDASAPTYTVRTDITWVDDCKNGNSSAASFDYKQLTVEVTWSDRSGNHVVRADTFRAPRSYEHVPVTVLEPLCTP